MANLTTDGQICIEREINVPVAPANYNNLTTRFEIVESSKWISENNFKTVCLQFPDELLPVSAKIYEEIKKIVDVDLYILGDTSYASCCVDIVAAMHVQANAIIHYGYTCFSKCNIPVYYVLPQLELDVETTLQTFKEKFQLEENDKLCLFYGQEFEKYRDEITTHWFKYYPQSYIAYIQKEEINRRFLGRLVMDGNGGNFPVSELQKCICVFLGSRGQTLFNYTISVEAKEWYCLDPKTNNIEHLEETMWFKRRRFLIEKCKDAKLIGILVCKLTGHRRQNIVSEDIIAGMKQLCRVHRKPSYIVSVGKPNAAKLANFPEIDIYVMIACPENDLYSNRDFYKPIVYPYELEVALNSNRDPYFTTFVTDYDGLLPGKEHYCEIGEVKEETDVSLITGKIRETKVGSSLESSMALEEKQNWALENIGDNLRDRSWKGLEQKLGETEVKKAEEGRKGIALQYANEPDK